MYIHVDKTVNSIGTENWTVNGFDIVENPIEITRRLLDQTTDQIKKLSNQVILINEHRNRIFEYGKYKKSFDIPGYRGADCEEYAVALHNVVRKIKAWLTACGNLDSGEEVVAEVNPSKVSTTVTDKGIIIEKFNNC